MNFNEGLSRGEDTYKLCYFHLPETNPIDFANYLATEV